MLFYHPDQKFMAHYIHKWGGRDDSLAFVIRNGSGSRIGVDYCKPGSIASLDPLNQLLNKGTWQKCRAELGLNNPAHNLPPTIEEEEAFNEMEKKMIGQPPSKYHVCIKGVWLDVYDILHAYQRNNPADQHAVKKMLMPGQRGVKDAIQDRREAIQSLERAIELEGE